MVGEVDMTDNANNYFYGIPYYKCIEINGIVYSLDSFMAAFSLNQEITEKLFHSYEYIYEIFSCATLKSDLEIAYRKIVFEVKYNSSKSNNLKAYIVISRKDGEVANGFIHFNPNRLFQSPRAYTEIKRFLAACSTITVKKCDVAIDMPYNIVSLTPLKGRKTMMIYIKSRKNTTFYWGNRSVVGCAKLYSKSLKNGLSKDVTRLELTLGNPESGDWDKNLKNAVPPIFMPPYSINSSPLNLTSPEAVILKLAKRFIANNLDRVELFRNLELYEDKARRKIIKDRVLAGSKQLQVDFNTINSIVRTTLSDITGT